MPAIPCAHDVGSKNISVARPPNAPGNTAFHFRRDCVSISPTLSLHFRPSSIVTSPIFKTVFRRVVRVLCACCFNALAALPEFWRVQVRLSPQNPIPYAVAVACNLYVYPSATRSGVSQAMYAGAGGRPKGRLRVARRLQRSCVPAVEVIPEHFATVFRFGGGLTPHACSQIKRSFAITAWVFAVRSVPVVGIRAAWGVSFPAM